MTIIGAAISVLKSEGRQLSAEEIYELICERNLFHFGAKDPLSVLKAELRRNCIDFQGKTRSPNPVLQTVSPGKYQLK